MRVAVLSFAHTRALTYAAFLRARPGVELVAADPGAPPGDATRGQAAAAGLGVAYANSWDEAFAMHPDAVVVTSETACHRDLVERAASAGAHVLCESPLAAQEVDAQAMIDACARAGVGLTTASPVRHSAAFAAVRRAVADGDLGWLMAVNAAHNTVPPVGRRARATGLRPADGGAIAGNAPYVTDLLDALLGGEPAEQVYAQANNLIDEAPDVETCALVTVRYPSGTIAGIDCSWSHPAGHRARDALRMTFVGEKASVEFDAFPRLLDGFDSATGREFWEADGTDLDAAMLEEFISGVHSGSHTGPDGEAGLRTLRIVLAAYSSLQTGQPVMLRKHDTGE